MIRRVAAALGALLLACLLYLSWTVAEARAHVVADVDRVIATADQANFAIPPRRVAMLLAVQDPGFWSGSGVALTGPDARMTTVAQSVGKKLFFRHFQPGLRKFPLMATTRFALVPKVSKPDILKAFLALAYFGSDAGRPVTGFADGARTWLGKPLATLTDREWIELVAMLPAPDRLKGDRGRSERLERVRRIERLLAGHCRQQGVRDVTLEGCA
ncbi:glycosyl transferase [Sphingomonas ginkgonis]|uniref:Glycosyl transferase n=1 Tax=Sphingomonas ginkgonis TaxID=2315330 RepID=A0A3R9Z7W8_9SPHN|nr:transglycosylase domain-containing protein [Sphingomonas ginkgonis]RST31927.1 glycosyl transferase [Sphingomonas ginkgonis]